MGAGRTPIAAESHFQRSSEVSWTARAPRRQQTHLRRTSAIPANASSSPPADTAAGSSGATSGESASATAVASVAAAAAVVGAVAVAAAPPPAPPRTTATRLLSRTLSLLRAHLPALLLLYALKDGASFLLHRVTQRLTNHVAEVLLGVPTSTAGNPWWLYLDQAFIRAHPGYEVLVGLFFLLFLPFSIALNSAAFSVAALLCTPPEMRALAAVNNPAAARPGGGAAAHGGMDAPAAAGAAAARGGSGRSGNGGGGPLPMFSLEDDPGAASLADIGIQALPPASPPPSPPPRHPAEGSSADAASASAAAAAALTAAAAAPGEAGQPAAGSSGDAGGGPIATLRAALGSIASVLPEAGSSLRRVWWADMHLNARALPLQVLCLLVFPAIWAVPRLLRLQLTLPAAVLEGRAGRDAIHRSGGLIASSLAAYGMPFAVLLAGGRLIEYVQGLALALIPPRWWRDVVEVPLLISGGFLLVKACVARLQDLLPLAAYLDLAQQEVDNRRRQQEEIAAALLQQQQQQHQHHKPHDKAPDAAGGPVAAAATAKTAAA